MAQAILADTVLVGWACHCTRGGGAYHLASTFWKNPPSIPRFSEDFRSLYFFPDCLAYRRARAPAWVSSLWGITLSRCMALSKYHLLVLISLWLLDSSAVAAGGRLPSRGPLVAPPGRGVRPPPPPGWCGLGGSALPWSGFGQRVDPARFRIRFWRPRLINRRRLLTGTFWTKPYFRPA